MEGHVRVTVSGPVLATLILAGWLELQGLPPWQQATDPLESGGTMNLRTEHAEYWVELPCDLIYDLTSDVRGPKRATLRRANAKGVQVATYLLQLEEAGGRRQEAGGRRQEAEGNAWGKPSVAALPLAIEHNEVGAKQASYNTFPIHKPLLRPNVTQYNPCVIAMHVNVDEHEVCLWVSLVRCGRMQYVPTR